MTETIDTAISPPAYILLHYADGRGVASRRAVTVQRARLRAGRLTLQGRCHLREANRSFLGSGILDIIDPDTGELLPAAPYLASLLHAPTEIIAAALTAPAGKRRRTRELGTGINADGLPTGWVFGVPSAFRDALDIRRTAYLEGTPPRHVHYWTRGIPPIRAFAAGDIFYDPPDVRGLIWSACLLRLNRLVQVIRATPDPVSTNRPDQTGGTIQFRVTQYVAGEPSETREHECNQAEFEEFLRTGVVP